MSSLRTAQISSLDLCFKDNIPNQEAWVEPGPNFNHFMPHCGYSQKATLDHLKQATESLKVNNKLEKAREPITRKISGEEMLIILSNSAQSSHSVWTWGCRTDNSSAAANFLLLHQAHNEFRWACWHHWEKVSYKREGYVIEK